MTANADTFLAAILPAALQAATTEQLISALLPRDLPPEDIERLVKSKVVEIDAEAFPQHCWGTIDKLVDRAQSLNPACATYDLALAEILTCVAERVPSKYVLGEVLHAHGLNTSETLEWLTERVLGSSDVVEWVIDTVSSEHLCTFISDEELAEIAVDRCEQETLINAMDLGSDEILDILVNSRGRHGRTLTVENIKEAFDDLPWGDNLEALKTIATLGKNIRQLAGEIEDLTDVE